MTAEILPQSNDIISDVVSSDIEWSGSLNRALGQGDKFALLLAMLEDDYLQRPNVSDSDDEATTSLGTIPKHYYPQIPLQAESRDWVLADTTSKLMAQNVSDALLWQKMHPQPLATFNDAKRIEAEIKINCGFQTQQRFQHASATKIDVDETKLYDILNAIN